MNSYTAVKSGSRIPNFFKLGVNARIEALRERTALTEEDLLALECGSHTLKLTVADKMIENVIGVLGLPLGVGLNFLVDGRDVIVPLLGRGTVHCRRALGRRAHGPPVRWLPYGGHRAGADRPGSDRERRRPGDSEAGVAPP